MTPFAIVFIAFVVALSLLVIGICLGVERKQESTPLELPISPTPATTLQSNSVALAPSLPISPDTSSHNGRRFTSQQIRQMTSNYGYSIGRGGFGSVYYGCMTDCRAVAVKRLSAQSDQGTKEFQNEVDILLRVHHRNLASLIGYCEESQERILVYEFVEQGTLKDHLHPRDNVARMPSLDWKTRIRIALDAANGLKYLHTDCDPKIIHRDVKPSNILLDKKLRAKIADFGLSRSIPRDSLTHITTVAKGTLGYLDPECTNGLDRLTCKSDVYSFGIVLLELLSGVTHIVENPFGFQNISQWASPYILSGQVDEIMDKSLEGCYNMEACKELSLLALKCVKYRGADRPSMSEVLQQLERIAQTYLQPRS